MGVFFWLQKTPEIRGFQVFFEAAGPIRTADLILTNYKKAVVACRWLLCLIACIPLFSTVAGFSLLCLVVFYYVLKVLDF